MSSVLRLIFSFMHSCAGIIFQKDFSFPHWPSLEPLIKLKWSGHLAGLVEYTTLGLGVVGLSLMLCLEPTLRKKNPNDQISVDLFLGYLYYSIYFYFCPKSNTTPFFIVTLLEPNGKRPPILFFLFNCFGSSWPV